MGEQRSWFQIRTKNMGSVPIKPEVVKAFEAKGVTSPEGFRDLLESSVQSASIWWPNNGPIQSLYETPGGNTIVKSVGIVEGGYVRNQSALMDLKQGSCLVLEVFPTGDGGHDAKLRKGTEEEFGIFSNELEALLEKKKANEAGQAGPDE